MSRIQKHAIAIMALATAESAYEEQKTEFVFCGTLFRIERFGKSAGRCTVNGSDCGIRFYKGKAVFC